MCRCAYGCTRELHHRPRVPHHSGKTRGFRIEWPKDHRPLMLIGSRAAKPGSLRKRFARATTVFFSFVKTHALLASPDARSYPPFHHWIVKSAYSSAMSAHGKWPALTLSYLL